MTTAAPSAALATIQPIFTDAERVALARNELGALLVAAGLGSSTEHALISLLALNGLGGGLGGHRRRHRAPGPGARPPDPDHHPQGRQDRHHPARTAHRPGDRPG